ncbi:MAG: hypothetical protein DRJ49_01465 [Thermoprotei archaeon]|nr:MAG: hypothetical protein DRJ49_01465 [Thermoprotei archaeon]
MSIDTLTEEELYKIYSILANRVKRNIIKILGDRGKASATEMRKELKISVGALYYNLDDLVGYVAQDYDKKYKLTERGKIVYNILINERERVMDLIATTPHPLFDRLKYIVETLFIPFLLLVKICRNFRLVVPLSIVVMLLGILGMRIGNFELLLISPIDNSRGVILAYLTSDVRILVSIIMSWLLVFMICEVGSLMMGSRTISSELISATMISLLPIFMYPYINLMLARLHGTLLGHIILGIALRLLQLMSLCFLTAFIASYKKLRIAKSFIVSTIVFYTAIIIESLMVFD